MGVSRRMRSVLVLALILPHAAESSPIHLEALEAANYQLEDPKVVVLDTWRDMDLSGTEGLEIVGFEPNQEDEFDKENIEPNETLGCKFCIHFGGEQTLINSLSNSIQREDPRDYETLISLDDSILEDEFKKDYQIEEFFLENS